MDLEYSATEVENQSKFPTGSADWRPGDDHPLIRINFVFLLLLQAR